MPTPQVSDGGQAGAMPPEVAAIPEATAEHLGTGELEEEEPAGFDTRAHVLDAMTSWLLGEGYASEHARTKAEALFQHITDHMGRALNVHVGTAP